MARLEEISGPHLEDYPEAAPVDHAAMLDRIGLGQRIHKILKAADLGAQHGAKEGFGDSPIGMTPGSEMSQFLARGGLKYEPGISSSPLTALFDPLVRSAAFVGDLTMRGVQAGMYAYAGATSQFAESSGLMSPANSQKLAQDMVIFANMTMMAEGMHPNPLARMRHLLDGRVAQEPVGRLPTPGDFFDVAEALHEQRFTGRSVDRVTRELEEARTQARTDQLEALRAPENDPAATQAAARQAATSHAHMDALERELEKANNPPVDPLVIRDKLQQLYEETGVHPNEVLADAMADPALRAELTSDTPLLPSRYTGVDPAMLAERQRALLENSGENVALIPGISRDLNLALETRTVWPETATTMGSMEGRATPTMRFGDWISRQIERFNLGDVVKDIQMKFTPMTERNATVEARAAAKDFANTLRVARWDGQHIDGLLAREFTPEQLRRMWEAADLEGVALRTGTPPAPAPGMIRMYRGEGKNVLGQSGANLRFMTPNLEKAKLYGDVKYVDIPNTKEGMRSFVQGAGGIDEFVTDAPNILDAMKPYTGGTDLSSLTPTERAVVKKLQARATQAWEDAKKAGVVREDARPLPSYVPRMVINSMDDVLQKSRALDQPGHNLRTTTKNTMRRKHLTVEETEAAAKAALGEDAEVVRDIRTLNLATSKLQEAVAGRQLVNRIRDLGKELGEELVTNDAGHPSTFTIDHPSLKEWRPKFGPDGRVVIDEAGKTVFEKQPVYIHTDFEGPLRAVLTKPDGAAYSALMSLKEKATVLIMYSPLLHNAVIFARVLPAASREVAGTIPVVGPVLQHIPVLGNLAAAVRMYFTGNAVKNNAVLMRQAIADGVVPIGRNGAAFDITSIASSPEMAPGRSITAQVLAAVPNLFSKTAGDAVLRTVDRAGVLWHETLLWDRVADVQMGVWDHYRTSLVKDGYDVQTAGRLAAHLANRYTGALPPEAMSNMSRKIANVGMFSRSFTLGNLGAMKDMFVGMPRDIQAQIARDQGFAALANTRSMMQRKALGIVAMDAALFYAGNSLFQSAIEVMRTDTTMGEEALSYLDRFAQTFARRMSNPYEALNPLGWMKDLSSTSANEPGKEDRIFTGYQSDGTAIYAKNPFGKTGEETIGWMTHPGKMVDNKLSTLVKPLKEIQANKNFKDKNIYDPYPETAEDQVKNVFAMVWHFMKAQMPTDPVEAAYDLIAGTPTPDEKNIDTARLIGPLMGMMFSQGAQGGMAIGELNRAKEKRKFKIDQAMPGIQKDIKEDRMSEAMEKMDALDIPPKLQKFFVETTLDPSAKITKRAMKELMQSLPEEHQDKIRAHIERNAR